MLEGLFDADRWSTTFQNMGPFWGGLRRDAAGGRCRSAAVVGAGHAAGCVLHNPFACAACISRVTWSLPEHPLPVQVLFMYIAGPRSFAGHNRCRPAGAHCAVRLLGFLGVGLYHAAYTSRRSSALVLRRFRGQMEAAQSQGLHPCAGILVHRAAPDIRRSFYRRCVTRRSTWSRIRRCWRLWPAATLCTVPTTL